AAWWASRAARDAAWTEQSRQLISAQPIGKGDRPRVVLVAGITTTPRWSLPLLAFAFIVLAFLPFLVHMALENPGRHPSFDVKLLLLVVSWLGGLLAILCSSPRAKPAAPGDGRTGLSLLAEFGRTWPGGLAARADMWLVATSNSFHLNDLL